MSPHLQRAILLMQQQRIDSADEQLRQAIIEEPHNAYAHSLLALCLLRQERFDPATEEAQQAIGLAPDFAFAHYVLSEVFESRNRFPEAKEAILEAIRLEPDDADFFAQLAGLEMQRRDWPAALAAADNGLKIDPEHVHCTNIRVQALTKLGRRTDADAAVEAALRRTPDDAYTHANRGWTLLEKGDPAKAMEHFRESLRLNPNLEWARAGIVESLKARHFVYRWMLRYFFWMSRLSSRAQWGVLMGAWLLIQILNSIEQSYPGFAIIARPITVAYVVFVVLTWLSKPLFNSLLRLNKFGRLVLQREEVWQSNLVCLFLFPAIVAGVLFAVWGLSARGLFALTVAIACGFESIFVSNVFNCAKGWPRLTMIAGAVLFVITNLMFLRMLSNAYAGNDLFLDKAFDNAISWRDTYITPLMLALFIGGNFLAMAKPKR